MARGVGSSIALAVIGWFLWHAFTANSEAENLIKQAQEQAQAAMASAPVEKPAVTAMPAEQIEITAQALYKMYDVNEVVALAWSEL